MSFCRRRRKFDWLNFDKIPMSRRGRSNPTHSQFVAVAVLVQIWQHRAPTCTISSVCLSSWVIFTMVKSTACSKSWWAAAAEECWRQHCCRPELLLPIKWRQDEWLATRGGGGGGGTAEEKDIVSVWEAQGNPNLFVVLHHAQQRVDGVEDAHGRHRLVVATLLVGSRLNHLLERCRLETQSQWGWNQIKFCHQRSCNVAL